MKTKVAKDFVVKTLPGLSEANLKAVGNMHAGLIPIGDDSHDNGALFFWMFSQPANTKKLVFWLNGGPGCSSMDGLFLENGPFIPTKDKTLLLRESTWINSATVVYVDQPVGTGYAIVGQKSGFMRTLSDVAVAFHAFLDQFFAVFPELLVADVYIAGESFAGQYIPYIAKNIVEAKGGAQIKLTGLLIGNGWMDPERQYLSTVEYSKQYNLLSGEYLLGATKATSNCASFYNTTSSAKKTLKANECDSIMNYVLDNSTSVDPNACVNMYDVRLHDNSADGGCGLYSWPPHLAEMKAYLGRGDVREAVHVGKGDTKWEECAGDVYENLRGDVGEPSVALFPYLLENRVPILLFNGDMDLICNWFGIRDMVENLSWNGRKGLDNAMIQKWYINGEIQGWYQTSRNLTFVLKYNASHMMPVDSPMATTDLFNRFIGVDTNSSLVDDPLARNGFKGYILTDATTTSIGISSSEMFSSQTEMTSSHASTSTVPMPFASSVPAGDKFDYGNELDDLSPSIPEKEDSTSFGLGATFLIFFIVFVGGYLCYRMNRDWFVVSFGKRRLGKAPRSHEWMKLNSTTSEEELPVMGDDELDRMLELESGPSSRKRVVNHQ